MRRHTLALAFLFFVVLLGSAGVVRAPSALAPPAPAPVLAAAARSGPTPSVELQVGRPTRGRRTTVVLEAPEGMAHHGQIVVDVVDADGRPVDAVDVVPIDCPGFEAGPAGEHEAEVGPCALAAVRHDGAVLARGPVSTAVVDDDDPAYLCLEVPQMRYGGIGLEVAQDADGLRVVGVWPGAPADQAGLAAGDRIVAVEGRPVAGMGPERFAEETSGEEGTAVELTVALDGDTGTSDELGEHLRTLRVTRAFLQG